MKYVCLLVRAHVYIGRGMRQSGGFCESSCQLEGGLPKQRKAHRRCQSVPLLHRTALNDMNGILPVRQVFLGDAGCVRATLLYSFTWDARPLI